MAVAAAAATIGVVFVVHVAVPLPLLALTSTHCCFGERIVVADVALLLSSMEPAVDTVGVDVIVRDGAAELWG